MSLKADDLEVGDLVVVTEKIDEQPLSWEARRREPQELNGKPWRIAAVSLPFVIVQDVDGYIDTIDYRMYRLGRVSREYVRAWEKAAKLPGLGADSPYGRSRGSQSRIIEASGGLVSRRKRKSKPDPRTCPRCKDRMRERLKKGGVWMYVCPSCGLEQDPPTEITK